MRSFAAIATFAALAFSAVTSALPASPAYYPTSGKDVDTSAIDVTAIVHNINVIVQDSGNARVNLVNLGGSQTNHGGNLHLPGGGPSHPAPPHGSKGVPDVLVALNVEIIALVKDLTAKITADIEVDAALKLALGVFAKIKVLLDGACDDIKVIVRGDVDVALNLGGKRQDIKVVAELLATLLNSVVLVLGLAVKVCISIDISALLTVVVDIATSLSVIVGLVIEVAADLVVELHGHIQIIVGVIVGLKLQVLANILGISY